MQVGQLLITGIPGKTISKEEAEIIKKTQPGCFIIFGRNIESTKQLKNLIDELKYLSKIEPLITIDQEGGRVSRLRLIGEEPPNAQQLREKGDIELIKEHGKLTGRILRLFGFNLDLCPVLDISYNGDTDNSLLGRCYGLTTDEVVTNARAFNSALRNEGIFSCGKHFPGYSKANCDAHHLLPKVNETITNLESCEIIPYIEMIDEIDSVMVCHAHYSAFDPDQIIPASLSKNIVKNYLREKLGFKGIIMTDDLDMGAILNTINFEDCINTALNVGNDQVMICHRFEKISEAVKIMDKMSSKVLDEKLERISILKKNISPTIEFSIKEFDNINKEIWDLRVKTLGEKRAKIKSVEDGKRSPVETY